MAPFISNAEKKRKKREILNVTVDLRCCPVVSCKGEHYMP